MPNYYKSVESIVALEQVMTSSYVRIGAPNKALIDQYRTGDKRKSLFYMAISMAAYSGRCRHSRAQDNAPTREAQA